jgi:flagellar basal body-associated protein FliL
MEGGIAILLLLIIVAVVAVVGIAMYFTGGALWFSKSEEAGDSGRFKRPEHKKVTSETIENTELAGTRDDDR